MKKIDFGQIITILANIGVIAGIVFLGIELRQNNALLEAESLYARGPLDSIWDWLPIETSLELSQG